MLLNTRKKKKIILQGFQLKQSEQVQSYIGEFLNDAFYLFFMLLFSHGVITSWFFTFGSLSERKLTKLPLISDRLNPSFSL